MIWLLVDDSLPSVPLNNSLTGKSALLPKRSSWVYEPLEMDLHTGSGDDDTEPDSGLFSFVLHRIKPVGGYFAYFYLS